MSSSGDLTKAELLSMTPKVYLKDGFRDRDGRTRTALVSTSATAVATQMEAAEVSPQELSATLEALRQALPWHKGPVATAFPEAVEEALDLVSSMYGKDNNPGIVNWLDECTSFVVQPADIEDFLSHFMAVVRQYGAIVALRKP